MRTITSLWTPSNGCGYFCCAIYRCILLLINIANQSLGVPVARPSSFDTPGRWIRRLHVTWHCTHLPITHSQTDHRIIRFISYSFTEFDTDPFLLYYSQQIHLTLWRVCVRSFSLNAFSMRVLINSCDRRTAQHNTLANQPNPRPLTGQCRTAIYRKKCVSWFQPWGAAGLGTVHWPGNWPACSLVISVNKVKK